jgi:hypothetical protein
MLVLINSVLTKDTSSVSTKGAMRLVVVPRDTVEVKYNRDMISCREILDRRSSCDDLSGSVRARNTSLLHFHRIDTVEHSYIAEVERDGVNLDQNFIWSKLSL